MRKLIIAALILCLLGALAYGGRRSYRSWKTNRAVAKARDAFARSDYNNSLLWLRAALKANANSIEAIQLMGDFAELSRSPDSIFWRQRLVDLGSTSDLNRLLLARVAIVHREFLTAKKALDGVGEESRKSSEYQKISGAWAVATGRFPEAESRFREAMKLEPDNPVPQLSLAMILVERIDPQLAAQGLQMLERLSTNPAVRADALRHLSLDAVRRTNNQQALNYVLQLIRETNSIYNDRLLHLGILSGWKNPMLNSALATYQKASETNAQHVFALSRWMLGSLGSRETFAWLQSLSPKVATNFPVSMVMADAYMGITNWSGLYDFVKTQNWGELDYMRLAFGARALRERGLDAASTVEWSKVLKAAEGRLDRLQALRRLTVNWSWVPETEEVLWQIINRFPGEKGALVELSGLLTRAGKTRSLLTLYSQAAKLDPDNLPIRNNLASIALLLNSEQHKPHELARELYEKERNNADYVSTYAYSLHLQKKNTEGLRIMSQLKPEYLDQPNVAGYYGLLLATAGDRVNAKKYLDLAAGANLLPEERELFQRQGKR